MEAGQFSRQPYQSLKESGIRAALFLCAGLSLVVTFGIIWVLITESIPFFTHVSLKEFFTESRWTPLFDPAYFGIQPLLCGTFLIGSIAALFAVPIGVATAIYLNEYAPDGLRAILKPLLELLA